MPASVAKLLIALFFLLVTLLPAFLLACVLCWFTGKQKTSAVLFFVALILFTAIVLDLYADIIWDMQPRMDRPVEFDDPLPVRYFPTYPTWDIRRTLPLAT